MLLKFTTADILNTVLVDVSTGEQAYDIVTVLEEVSEMQGERPSADEPSERDVLSKERRRTSIRNASGVLLVSISWTGRRPEITILDEKVGQITDLFGSSTVKFMYEVHQRLCVSDVQIIYSRPKILVVPSRFDSEYVWMATPDSLTVNIFYFFRVVCTDKLTSYLIMTLK